MQPAQENFLTECGTEYLGAPKASWIYVRNNYDEKDQQLLRDLECSVNVFGREKGEKGTPHLQGFITFRKPYRFKGLQKVLQGWHIQPAISAEKAFNYCLKELDYEIKDTRCQGRRSELEGPAEMIKSKKRMREVAQTYPEVYIKHHRGFKALQAELMEDRHWYCECWIVHGPAGTCKTAFAKGFFGDWYMLTNKKWWQRYEGQRKVIVNEFSEEWWDVDTFCNIVDRQEYDVEIKGHSMPLQADHIIITTNENPDTWYRNSVNRKKFERRVKYVDFGPKCKLLDELYWYFNKKHAWGGAPPRPPANEVRLL